MMYAHERFNPQEYFDLCYFYIFRITCTMKVSTINNLVLVVLEVQIHKTSKIL